MKIPRCHGLIGSGLGANVRTCFYCHQYGGSPFRFKQSGLKCREYFHVPCFNKFKTEIQCEELEPERLEDNITRRIQHSMPDTEWFKR